MFTRLAALTLIVASLALAASANAQQIDFTLTYSAFGGQDYGTISGLADFIPNVDGTGLSGYGVQSLTASSIVSGENGIAASPVSLALTALPNGGPQFSPDGDNIYNAFTVDQVLYPSSNAPGNSLLDNSGFYFTNPGGPGGNGTGFNIFGNGDGTYTYGYAPYGNTNSNTVGSSLATVNLSVQAVPEPFTMVLSLGAVGLAVRLKLRNEKSVA